MYTPLTKTPGGPGEGSSGKFFASSDELVKYLKTDEFARRGEWICRWVVRNTQFQWESILNEAYLKIMRSTDLPTFFELEDNEAFYRLFRKIAENIRNDRWRKGQREGAKFTELSGLERMQADPSVDLEYEILRREFAEKIEALPDERKRLAVNLRIQGRTFREIADRVGVTHACVQVWIKDIVLDFLDGKELEDDSETKR